MDWAGRHATACLSLVAAFHLPGPAHAQTVDFETLFSEHQDEVVQIEATRGTKRRLQLGSVLIDENMRAGERSYVAIDHSAHGAVFCAALIYQDMKQLADMCEGTISADGHTSLDRQIDKLNRFIARNTFPAVDVAQMEAFWAERSRARGPLPATLCATLDNDGYGQMLNALVTPEAEERLDQSLRVDRLPVTNPCL